MLQLLGRARTTVLGQMTKTIGGYGDRADAIEHGLHGAQHWTQLAMAATGIECPTFEVVQAFHVFDITAHAEKCQRNVANHEVSHQLALEPLAHVYENDEPQLQGATI